MLNTHVAIDDPGFTDLIAAVIAVATMGVLVVVALLVLVHRKHGAVKLLGRTMPLCSLSAATSVCAVLMTNGYMGGKWATSVRTASCQLWDYFVTMPSFAVFFGSIASMCLAARLARILYTSSARMNTTRDSLVQRESEQEGDAESTTVTYSGPVDNVNRRAVWDHIEGAQKHGKKIMDAVFVDAEGALIMNPYEIENGVRAMMVADGQGNQRLYEIGGDDEENDCESEEMREEFVTVSTQHSTTVPLPVEDMNNDALSMGVLDIDPSVPTDNEYQVNIFGVVVFVRPGFALQTLFGFIGKGSAVRNTWMAQAFLWAFVLTTALMICVFSVIPGATTWDADAASCYSEMWIKTVVLFALFFWFSIAGATVVTSAYVKETETTSMSTVLRVCRRNFAVPLYAKLVGDDEYDGGDCTGATNNSVRNAVRRTFSRSVAYIVHAIVFLTSMLLLCFSVVKFRVVYTEAVEKFATAKTSNTTYMPKQRDQLCKCAVLCMSASAPGRAQVTISSNGTPYLMASGSSAYGSFSSDSTSCSIVDYMKVRHAYALLLFAVSLAILIPLNLSGYVATTPGRFLYMITTCVTYLGCIYLIGGIVLVDVLFNGGMRFREGVMIMENHEIPQRTVYDAWCKRKTTIVGDFLDYVTNHHANTAYHVTRTTRGNRAMLKMNGVYTGKQMIASTRDEGILYVDKMILLATGYTNSNSACSVEANADNDFPGIGAKNSPIHQLSRLRMLVLDPTQARDYTDACFREETIEAARYRAPCFCDVMREIIECANIGHDTTKLDDYELEHLSMTALVILGAIYWEEFCANREKIHDLHNIETGTDKAEEIHEYV